MREAITVAVGVAIAAIGVIVFLYAHTYSTNPYLQDFSESYRHLHEALWAVFGIAILLSGAIIAAVGFASWCNNRRA